MQSEPPQRRWPLLGSLVLGGVATAAFLAIRRAGGHAAMAPAAAAPPVTPHGPEATLFHVLLALAAVVVAGHLLGRLFRYLRQPPVIGEVVAGILLGPSLLGHAWPMASAFLFPATVVPLLGVLAQVGVVLYMFVVGLELDVDELRRSGPATVTVAQAGMVVPFILGAALALVLHPVLSTSAVPFTPFALFLGVALSVTAFPVLARILSDTGLARTQLGVAALGAAAMADVMAWCLLALVLGVAQSDVHGALRTTALTMAYVAAMWFVVRPALLRYASHWLSAHPDRSVLASVLIGVLLSSLATELIGVHALFGAFLFGAVIPQDSSVARDLIHRLEDLVTVLLLPAFFAFTGLRTQIGLLAGPQNWMLCGLIVLVACAGKLGGTLAAARWTGFTWRESSCLGVLMNTRGLVELIVLNIGLELGVISPTLFTMLVVMALLTTLAAAPLLSVLWPAQSRPQEA